MSQHEISAGASNLSTVPNLHLALKVRAFRAFRDDATLNLRPLTLLYGHNQAGKSSLLRLVSLVSDSLRGDTPILDLQSPSLRGASFKDLGWMGKEPVFTPSLTVGATAKPNAPSLMLQYADDGGMIVNRVRIERGARERVFDVRFQGREAFAQGRAAFKFEGDNADDPNWSGSLSFPHFLPEGAPESAASIIREIDDSLLFLKRVRWLHANRIGDDADRAAENSTLLAATLQEPRYRKVLEEASQWLREKAKICDEVTIRDERGTPRFFLGFSGREPLPLHLAGEGARSLLPLILCACWAEFGVRANDTSAPTMLAIEEPETNLHPHLHILLFERLLDTVRAGIPVILETHSVYVLRAMQRAVLKKEISHEQVGLHWVSQGSGGAATVEPIQIGPDAGLSNWRPDAYEKEQELAHEILDLRWKQLEKK